MRIKIQLTGDKFIRLRRQIDRLILKNIREVICGEKFGAIVLSFSPISRNLQTKYTPMQLESSGFFGSDMWNPASPRKLLLFSFGRRGILHTIWNWTRLLKEESGRWKLNCTKRGRIYTMTCTAFNLTALQLSSLNKGYVGQDTQHAYEKGKNIQNISRKIKTYLYREAVETSRLKTAFLAYGQKHSDAT